MATATDVITNAPVSVETVEEVIDQSKTLKGATRNAVRLTPQHWKDRDNDPIAFERFNRILEGLNVDVDAFIPEFKEWDKVNIEQKKQDAIAQIKELKERFGITKIQTCYTGDV